MGSKFIIKRYINSSSGWDELFPKTSSDNVVYGSSTVGAKLDSLSTSVANNASDISDLTSLATGSSYALTAALNTTTGASLIQSGAVLSEVQDVTSSFFDDIYSGSFSNLLPGDIIYLIDTNAPDYWVAAAYKSDDTAITNRLRGNTGKVTLYPIEDKTIISHASSAYTYGLGTASLFGHVKLYNSILSDSSTNEDGVACGKGHTHSQYLTAHQSLSGYATQTWVQNTALSGYATQSWVDSALGNYVLSSTFSDAIDDCVTTAGTGLSKSGATLNHSNSVSAVTTASLLKVKYDAQGHITDSSAVAKADITGLGIPAQDTTYSAGLNMSLSGTTFNLNIPLVASVSNISNPTADMYAFEYVS